MSGVRNVSFSENFAYVLNESSLNISVKMNIYCLSPSIFIFLDLSDNHCLKKVQIRRFLWSVFSCIRAEYGDLLSKNENENETVNCVLSLNIKQTKMLCKRHWKI